MPIIIFNQFETFETKKHTPSLCMCVNLLYIFSPNKLFEKPRLLFFIHLKCYCKQSRSLYIYISVKEKKSRSHNKNMKMKNCPESLCSLFSASQQNCSLCCFDVRFFFLLLSFPTSVTLLEIRQRDYTLCLQMFVI